MAHMAGDAGRNGFVVAGLAVLAGMMRFVGVGSQSVWLDEALSVHFASTYSVSGLLFELPLVDPHPPLYYLVLHAWIGVFGTSATSIRLLSVAFSVVAVVVIFYTVNRLFDRNVAVLSTLLFAVAPFQIMYAQEARMYALVSLLTVASFYFFVRLQQDQTQYNAAGYMIATVLLGYTHVYGLFIIAAQNLYVILQAYPVSVQTLHRQLRSWGMIQAGIGVALSPWLYVLVQRAVAPNQDTALYWLTDPNWIMLVATPAQWLYGSLYRVSMVNQVIVVMAVVVMLLPIVIRYRGRTVLPVLSSPTIWPRFDLDFIRQHTNHVVLVLLWMIVPVVLAYSISHFVRPIYVWRATIVAAPAFYIITAVSIQRISSIRLRSIIVVLIFIGLLFPLSTYYNGNGVESWNTVTDDLQENASADDLIVLSDYYTQVPFNYYWNGSQPTVHTIAEDEHHVTGIHDTYDRIPVDDLSRTQYNGVWAVISHTSEQHRHEIITALEQRYELQQTRTYTGDSWTLIPPTSVTYFTPD